jgi:DNA-binding NtrC family response regulator
VIEPEGCALALANAFAGCVVLVDDPEPSAWGRAVLAALARAGVSNAIVLVLTEKLNTLSGSVELHASLDAEARSRFLEAIVDDAHGGLPGSTLDLAALDVWWTAHGSAREAPAASEDARRLFHALSLARRPWPVAHIGELGSEAALSELLARAALERSATHAWIASDALDLDREARDSLRVADALVKVFAKDPWACMRASELQTEAGTATLAEELALQAIAAMPHQEARKELWLRWRPDHENLPAADALERLTRAAERALEIGDSDVAVGFARRAIARDGRRFSTLITLGCAEAASGDLTAATVALERGQAAAQNPEERAEAAEHLAEVAYLTGSFDRARKLAQVAETSSRARVQLHARNVLGKVLLAESRLDEADHHFAEDAHRAGVSGEHVAELRANLNRAVIKLLRGRHDEAKILLLSVLNEGEKLGAARVIGHALSNLAVSATLRHQYAEALALGEHAIEARLQVGENLPSAHAVMNQTWLRLRVGLLDEAEQGVARGRAACGATLPLARAAEFALVGARIHLARGRTLHARAELANATKNAKASGDDHLSCLCHITATRLALEDGDLARAAKEIEFARSCSRRATTDAEVAVLEATRGRAAGELYEEQAISASEQARAVEDPDLIREALVLCYHARSLVGDEAAARERIAAAIKQRDSVADSLPPELRQHYLAKRELAELARLEQTLVPGVVTLSDAPQPRTAPRRVRGLIGESPRMLALRAAIEKVGPSDATVLVLGESGSGKELVAEALHAESARSAGPMVKVNCAALAETLLLSELFGHEKGSFTGALARRLGRFELAKGGTLFLDEIGDISPATQVALLRVLQDRTFERVGGATSITVDVRLVFATNRDLRDLVSRGNFREDLYYRLNGIVLELPAMRERISDLPLLAEGLLGSIAAERKKAPKRLSAAALTLLTQHDWPGNVRELENALRTVSIFADGDVIDADDLRQHVNGLSPERAGGKKTLPGAYEQIQSGVSLRDLKRDLERECIARALRDSGGNITHAAALLGLKRPRLSQLVKKHRLLVTDPARKPDD